ncbi:MAG: metal-dependent hydrolase [Desulfurococcaceae archaeon]
MLGSTHVLFSVALILWLYPVRDPLAIALLSVLSGIGSTVPDLDLRFKHRKALHNLFVPFIIAVLLIMVFSKISGIELYVSAFVLGWLSHILLDALTVKGVYMFYPLYNRGFKIGLCRSNSFACNFLLSALSVALISLRTTL